MTNTSWYNEFFGICSALECKSCIHKEKFNTSVNAFIY